MLFLILEVIFNLQGSFLKITSSKDLGWNPEPGSAPCVPPAIES